MNKISENFINVVCPVCASDHYSVKYQSGWPEDIEFGCLIDVYSSSSDHKLLDRLVICNSCGLGYLNPRLDDKTVFQSYSIGEDTNFVAQDKFRISTFNNFLKRFKKKYALNPGSKVLDIGTAGGAFLEAARMQGLDAYGVEPSKWLSSYARSKGLNVVTGSLDDAKFDKYSFDVVTLWDVIEHLTDVNNVLESIHKLLNPNGLLVVNFPDFGSFPAKILGKKWPFLLSVHLLYFNRQNMKLLLEKNGYCLVEVSRHAQSLGLGYVLMRASAYFPFIRIFEKLSFKLGISNIPIIYWIGQTRIIAKKNEN